MGMEGDIFYRKIKDEDRAGDGGGEEFSKLRNLEGRKREWGS